MLSSLNIISIAFFYMWNQPVAFSHKTGKFVVVGKLSELKMWLLIVLILQPLTLTAPGIFMFTLARWGLLNLSTVETAILQLCFAFGVLEGSVQVIFRRYGRIISVSYWRLLKLMRKWDRGKTFSFGVFIYRILKNLLIPPT